MSKAWDNKNKNFETRFKSISKGTNYKVKTDKYGTAILDENGKLMLELDN